MNKRELDRIYRFIIAANRVKAVKRAGWAMSNIDDAEHVGDHSFGVALLSFVMAKKMGLDAGRAMEMGLIHDICEAVHGDIPRRPTERLQGMSDRKKEEIEGKSMRKMLSYLPAVDRRYMQALWDESNAMETRESKVVRAADGVDLLFQLLDYARYIRRDGRLREFFITSRRKIRDPEFLYLYDKIKRSVYAERGMRPD